MGKLAKTLGSVLSSSRIYGEMVLNQIRENGGIEIPLNRIIILTAMHSLLNEEKFFFPRKLLSRALQVVEVLDCEMSFAENVWAHEQLSPTEANTRQVIAEMQTGLQFFMAAGEREAANHILREALNWALNNGFATLTNDRVLSLNRERLSIPSLT